MITLRDCPLSDYEKELEKTTDYSIVGHDLSMYGYCPECKNKINRPQNDNRE
jgi:Fur family ferric uptake transcriptional regulator